MQSDLKSITKTLLKANEYVPGFWAMLERGRRPTMKEANLFLLVCILDYQIPSHKALENARRLAEKILDNPKKLWHTIASVSLSVWESKRNVYRLHRFPVAHTRVWKIASEVVRDYEGDARKIWEGQNPCVTLSRLNKMHVGEQISRMIVGGLCDTEQIFGTGDVKVDIHVRRSLGRLIRGKKYEARESNDVLRITREMNPSNPWKLDKPLYELGKAYCHESSPDCNKCPYAGKCAYAKN